ncbi:hypothetical protein ABZU32_27695 [Sphaerisporangium sp. NPDC005288]|uniref:hypothetical protein n=1 Tax=Sphaerisporangium sp. NPDC005288 TaxID=3155114 RepID=UPI0033ADE1FC
MTDGSGAKQGRSPVFTVALTLVGAFLLYLAVPNIGPVVRAARADGVPGVFTAETLSCIQHPGHESCSWTGEFRSDDGAVQRSEVVLYGADRESLRPGERARAVDTGRAGRVYGPGGSREWVFTALLLLAGLAIVLFPYARPLRRLLRPPAPRAVPVGGGPGR